MENTPEISREDLEIYASYDEYWRYDSGEVIA